jgi:hypothetical protein
MLLLIPATADTSVTSAAYVAGMLGFILWDVAYVLIILKGRRDKSYGVPLVAICLNVTWELFFAVLCPQFGIDPDCTSSGVARWALISWLVLDLVILGQLFQFGWSQPPLQRYLPSGSRKPVFNALLCGLLLMGFIWQYTWVSMVTDKDGNSLAWVTNAIMSALFVRSAIYRPSARGLSFAAGWAMLAGNCAFVVWSVLTNFAEFTAWHQQWIVVLMCTVIAGNLLYLFVLWHKTRVVAPNAVSPATQ